MFQPELEADRSSSSGDEVKTVRRHSVRGGNFAFIRFLKISNSSDIPALRWPA